jgi:predicted Rossmann fold nucleotide-binding protein DprA/Smf involved in DNA uptake
LRDDGAGRIPLLARPGTDARPGRRLSARLLKEFGSPDEVFWAPLPHLQRYNLPTAVAQAVHKKQAFKRAEKELASTQRLDRCHLLNWTEPEYPQTLLQIYDPPVLLYACYPKENRKLYEQVREHGAIISEFPLGTHPAPENFPIRNRIVAGMPLGVVVVEGAQYSGSLITARLAMEFGREVFGVPGNVTQPVSFALNQLIKQGAKLVTNGEDVIEELPTASCAGAGRAAGGCRSATSC